MGVSAPITTSVWEMPSGFAWAIYRAGHLVAQGSRCATLEQAERFMEANKRMIEEAA